MNAETPELLPGHIDRMKFKGHFSAKLKKADGRVIEYEQRNLVVDVGVDFICDAMAKPSARPNVLSHIGIGEGTTAADAGDTALETELDRNAATYTHNAGDAFFTMEATFGAGEGTGDVSEAGLFNAASTGTMFNRVVFSAIPKEASDTLDITFTITFTPA